MIELLKLASRQGYGHLEQAVTQVLSLECWDAAAVRYLMSQAQTSLRRPAGPIEVGAALACYERPLPEVRHYDQLLAWEGTR